MEIREVSLNTVVRGVKSGPSLATYVSPPRPNMKKAAALSPEQPSSTYAKVEMNTSLSPVAHPSAAIPGCTEVAEINYAECPCATCANYRAYYAMQMTAGAGLHTATTVAYAALTGYTQDGYTQQQPLRTPSQPSVALGMEINMHRQSTHGVPPAVAYSSLPGQKEERKMPSTLYCNPRVSEPITHVTSMVPLDAVEEFERSCVGSVAKLACSAEGRAVLLSAMSSQDAAVINTMVNEIVADVETVALDNNGCQVLRAIVDYMNAEQMTLLVSSFSETLVLNLCTVSQYSRRVLQALFERPLIDLQPVVDVLAANAQYLSATQQGCISLMRVFEQCSEKQQVQLMALLVPIFAHIALDPFGNYVVQCVIEHGGKTMAAKYTLTCFPGEFLNMSCSKYASNVVEKIIKTCGDVPAVRRLLMDELIYNPAALLQVVQDNFGNFVVQSIIEHTENPAELKRICDRLRPALPSSLYASRIETKLRAKHLIFQKQPNPHQQQARAPRQNATRRVHQQS